MGGGAKVSRKVYDYLYSLDYAICAGPLDQINMIWIKDKPVWCGFSTVRTDIGIYQPELFGGDDAEGGPIGVIEVYLGGADQLSSEKLAARAGRTVENMPGYRGLAHLFFRGSLEGEVLYTLLGNPAYTLFSKNENYIGRGAFLDTLRGGVRSASSGGDGFRWTTNNPYLPAMKVSVTRLPKQLGKANSRIRPPVNLGPDGEPLSLEEVILTGDLARNVVPGGFANIGDYSAKYWSDETKRFTVDLLDVFDTQEELDLALGAGRIKAGWTAEGMFSGPASWQFEVAFHPDGGDDLPDFTPDIGLPSPGGYGPQSTYGITNSTGGAFATDFEATVPVGTRFVSYRATLNPSILEGFNGADVFEPTLTMPDLIVNHCLADGAIGPLPQANPAHIIYECLIDPEWGKGEDPAMIDTQSFRDAALTFRREYFGLTFTWMRQSEIEAFIGEVLDHVHALLFQDPATGLWTLKALRDDYETEGLLVLDPSNCELANPKRRAWGETINQIIVAYTDPTSEEEATVAAHNLASIAIQGGVISETRSYHGVRTAYLAQKIADRDVAEAGYPLFAATATADRRFWRVRPGDVLHLNWPEEGIEEMIVRVMRVDYGTPESRKIVFDIVEDIFSVDQTAYGTPQGPLWQPDSAVPEPLPYQMAITAPLPLITQSGTLLSEVDENYPAVPMLLLGAGTPSPIDIEVQSLRRRQNGDEYIGAVATIPPARAATLPVALVAEASSTLSQSFIAAVLGQNAEGGDLFMIGTDEATAEILMLEGYDGVTATWTVARGIWDTVPRDWPEGTRAWIMPDNLAYADGLERAEGDVIEYYMLPRTQIGRLPFERAVPFEVTASARPHLPFRPGLPRVDLVAFGLADYSAAAGVSSPPTSLPLNWQNRNRAEEDASILRWGSAGVTPEPGQTTVIRIYDQYGNFVNEVTGLSGNSYNLPLAALMGEGRVTLEFLSERDGLRSLMGHRIDVDVRQPGYGQHYGWYYGP